MELPGFITITETGVIVDAFVQPRAAKNSVAGVHGNALKLKVTAPPVDDRANRAVERFLADLVGIPPSRASVKTGWASRHKRVELVGISPEDIRSALDKVLTSPAHERGQEAPNHPVEPLEDRFDGGQEGRGQKDPR